MGDHLSRPPVARRLERRTRSLGGPRHRNLLRLAPDGVWLAAVSPRRWWALTPPFHPYRRHLRPGGLLSVPLSVGFRRLGFPQRPALRCPDFPRDAAARGHPACTLSVARTRDSAERRRRQRASTRPCIDAWQHDLGALPPLDEDRPALRAGDRRAGGRAARTRRTRGTRGSRRGRARRAPGRATGRAVTTLIGGSGRRRSPCREPRTWSA